MATMAALLKSSSSSSSYCTNQSPNRRFIITPPPAPTRISFPINRRLLFTLLTQNPLPEITTKCSSSSSSSRGSTFMEEEEEDQAVPFGILKEATVKKTLKAVKGWEKPALVAILVWVLLTKNPTIAYSSSSRTAFFGGVWFVYDVYKAIVTARRRIIDDDGSIRFYLGRVLGSTVLLSSGFMLLLMAVLLAGFLLFLCGSLAVIFLLTAACLGMVVGFGKVTWPSLMTEDESVNTTDEPEEEEEEEY